MSCHDYEGHVRFVVLIYSFNWLVSSAVTRITDEDSVQLTKNKAQFLSSLLTGD